MSGVMEELSREAAAKRDADDELAPLRAQFVIADETIYLDGNSLGRLPASTLEFLAHVIRDQWGAGLARSWSSWINWGQRIGDQLAADVLGAESGEVTLSDSTSVNLYKLATAAVDFAPDRRTIVFDTDDFPTDRYVLQGLADKRGLRVREIVSHPDFGLDLGELRAALDGDVALVVLSLVSYRSGALLDMAAVNALARRSGTLVLWDLSHAVGAVPIHLGEAGADLAVGCTYKYLNGGPGSPAFLYVRRDLQSLLRQPIWGWFGQRDQFRMGPGYDPVERIDRFLVGTPPVLSLAAVQPGLELVRQAGVDQLRRKGVLLGELVVALADRWLEPHGFRLASPRDPLRRGGHVSLAHPRAWPVCQALASRAGVVCDYRVPDRLRIAPVPAYTRFVDVWDAMDRLRGIVERGEHEELPTTLPRVT
ncbi:MAG: kynureninase [Pseudonocardiaceae bacterium]